MASKAALDPMPISPAQTKGSGQTGFTLVEVLMALVVLAIISAMLARVLQGSLNAKQIQRDEVKALNEEAETLTLQFAGELDEPLITIERIEDDNE